MLESVGRGNHPGGCRGAGKGDVEGYKGREKKGEIPAPASAALHPLPCPVLAFRPQGCPSLLSPGSFQTRQDPGHREAVSWERREPGKRVSSSQFTRAGAVGSHPRSRKQWAAVPLWSPEESSQPRGKLWGARGALLPTSSAPSLGVALNPLSYSPAGKTCPEHTQPCEEEKPLPDRAKAAALGISSSTCKFIRETKAQ